MNYVLATFALLSLALTSWQRLVARRFPLHQRSADKLFTPDVTSLKPLKGCDEHTEACLRSWLEQDYPGGMQFLFGVSSLDDPVCEIVRRLIREFPQCYAELVVCPESLGTNPKVSQLIQLERHAAHEIIVMSDADVRVPPDFLANVVMPLRSLQVGLVHCFYQLANPQTPAMQLEAVAINADFWSMVLQARSLGLQDFALGAVIATRRRQLEEIGGLTALADCLADDYQLGNRLARRGQPIVISPVVAEYLAAPMTWAQVWRHQLRWARTIRVSKPLPYFFSLLNNATLWPLLWLAVNPSQLVLLVAGICLLVRICIAQDLQQQLTRSFSAAFVWAVPVKDLLQAVLWFLAFTGNRIERRR